MDTSPHKPWKYCYWLDREAFDRLAASLQEKGIEMPRAKQNPCEALLGDIGCAAPEVWPAICRFDATPWYQASPYAGRHLVASSRPLDKPFDAFLATTIEPVDFELQEQPTSAQRRVLAENPAYRAREPQGWGAFPAEKGQAIIDGLEKVYGAKNASFADLLETWTAVHANFICPAYRSGDAFGNAPYSIAPSVQVSSCCVEMFNLLASPEKALLVRPCIGGVIVKAFEQDRYYLVRPAQPRR